MMAMLAPVRGFAACHAGHFWACWNFCMFHSVRVRADVLFMRRPLSHASEPAALALFHE